MRVIDYCVGCLIDCQLEWPLLARLVIVGYDPGIGFVG